MHSDRHSKAGKVKLGKRSIRATKRTLGWKIYNVRAHPNPRWRLVIDRGACAAFWKQTLRGSLPWIYLCKSF